MFCFRIIHDITVSQKYWKVQHYQLKPASRVNSLVSTNCTVCAMNAFCNVYMEPIPKIPHKNGLREEGSWALCNED